MNDLRFAIRQLCKTPGFTAVAVLSLALGIGANTAIFSLVNELLLRSLPVRDPGQLVLLRTVEGARGRMSRAGENVGGKDPATGRFVSSSFSLLIFERLRAQQSALSDLFAFAPFSRVNILIDGQAETAVNAQFISGTYHAGLGVPARLGRTIGPDDDREQAEPVAVISHRFWQRRFAGDPAVIGRTLAINRVPTTIVGVTPEGFDGALQAGESADVSVPLRHHLRFQPDRAGRAEPGYWWIRIMGRLTPGATGGQAVASLEPLFQSTAREGWLAGRTAANAGDPVPDDQTLVFEPGAQGENDTRRELARPLGMLMGLVGLVLAAACANVANLLLARAVARRRELATRLALGASRARLVWQLLAESLLLALAGAAVGLALAWVSRGLLTALVPAGNAAMVLDLPFDRRVLGFTLAAAAATTVLFGVAPALRATRVDLSAQFQGGGRAVSGRGSRLSRGLMVAQIALTLVLLVTTGLFLRTLDRLQGVDAGFDRQGLVLFRIDSTSAGYDADGAARLQHRMLAALEQIPGVRSATFSSVALLSAVRQNKRVAVPGRTPPAGVSPIVNTNGLAPNFFAAMGLPIVLGRGFTAADDRGAPRVAIVNRAFVRDHFGGANPVGHVMTIGPEPADRVAIVGVAGDARYTSLRGDVPATIYLPAFQRLDGQANFAVRVADAGQTAAVFAAIRSVVRGIDPSLPVLNLRTQEAQIDRLHAQERLFARLSGLFGVVALLLAGVGLHGLLSHAVLRRRREIGVRLAVGARPAQILQLVLGESMGLAGIGVALGMLAAWAASRLVSAMLFGVAPTDLVTYTAAAMVLLAMALVAAGLPARRASRVDPLIALRTE